jgi:hypothetical protein
MRPLDRDDNRDVRRNPRLKHAAASGPFEVIQKDGGPAVGAAGCTKRLRLRSSALDAVGGEFKATWHRYKCWAFLVKSGALFDRSDRELQKA